ncbi:MAG: 16S rRNA (cytosine(967)-C(5))-methyltransferase RsmB [Desulfobacteraceae bacterium]
MPSDPRRIAFKVLVRLEVKKVPLDQTLQDLGSLFDSLSERDRALSNGIIFGTLRQKASIDWIIRAFSNKPVEKIDPGLRVLIRIALFQIIHMDRIPVSAAVNTAVSIAGSEKGKGAAGFVNAVLRKAAKGHSNVLLPDPAKEPLLYTAVDKSMPMWLIKRWMARFGKDRCIPLLDIINTVPPITVRTNTLKTDRENLAAQILQSAENVETTRFAEQGISFTGPKVPLHKTDAFQNGFFQVQDEAAQITTSLLGPRPFDRILDVCAGLGGKTGHAAQLMDNRGEILATDVNQNRIASLEDEMNRLGVDIAEPLVADVLKGDLDPMAGSFDKVLVDAPCTGLGVLRRNPDAKWNKSAKDIKRNAEKQQRILLKSADLVKPSGCILFAVCSTEPEENEDVITRFLQKRRDFSVVPCRQEDFPDREAGLLFTDKGFFKSYPFAPFMDGFFAAKLEKTTGTVHAHENHSLTYKPLSGEQV